jgi:hypothetical protein
MSKMYHGVFNAFAKHEAPPETPMAARVEILGVSCLDVADVASDGEGEPS